jgi:hypothetical protein
MAAETNEHLIAQAAKGSLPSSMTLLAVVIEKIPYDPDHIL